MRSPIAYCGLTLALALAAGPAFAAELVTTSESDSDGPITSVLIVDPLDGAVIPPVYPVVIEYETFGGGLEIKLEVDDVEVGDCSGQENFTCTLEVTLTEGPHTLRARSFDNSHLISVTVDEGATTETDSSSGSDSSSDGSSSESSGPSTETSGFSTETEGESETSGNPTTGDTSGSATEGQPATDTDQPGGSSSSTGSTSDGAATGGDGDDKGCACSTGSSAPDLLGLALLGLLAPWRRRRA